MLSINNLKVNHDNKEILSGLNLNIKPGEVHAIMGPNGSGKSTLAKVVAGFPDYKISNGSIHYLNQSLDGLDIHERSLMGIFLGMQYPVEIPGVNNESFLKEIFNAKQKHLGKPQLDSFEFREFLQVKLNALKMDFHVLSRGLNVGFSGGEKKKNEILQMNVLNPLLAILDETDSGLDIDALQVVANGINQFRNNENAVVLITHYNRLLEFVQPDFIHVLQKGKIVKSGDASLAKQLEESGYGTIN